MTIFVRNEHCSNESDTYFTVVYCYHIMLVFVTTGKRQLGRHRRRWKDNIKMDLQEVGCGAWTGLIWLRIGTGCGLL